MAFSFSKACPEISPALSWAAVLAWPFPKRVQPPESCPAASGVATPGGDARLQAMMLGRFFIARLHVGAGQIRMDQLIMRFHFLRLVPLGDGRGIIALCIIRATQSQLRHGNTVSPPPEARWSRTMAPSTLPVLNSNIASSNCSCKGRHNQSSCTINGCLCRA